MSTGGADPGRRVWFGVAVLVGCLLVAAVTSDLWWPARPAPQPPELPLDTFDPEVAAVISAERDNVLARPNSDEAWGRLGMALLGNDLRHEAASCFEEAERLRPAEPRWPHLRGLCLSPNDPRAAMSHIRRAIGSAGGDATQTGMRLILADILLEEGRLEEAEAEADVLAKTAPTHPGPRYIRGVIAARRGDWAGCVALLTPLTERPETGRKATLLLAAAHGRLGNTELAASLAAQAQGLPRDAPWQDPFLEECNQFARGPVSKFGEVNGLLRRSPEEAVRALERLGEATRGRDGRAFTVLSTELAKAGQHEQAERAAREGLASSPDSRAALLALAAALIARAEREGGGGPAAAGRLEEAERLAGRSLGGNPNDAQMLLTRGRARLALGRREEGLADLRAAVACRPDYTAGHLRLGEAALGAGLLAEAREAFTRAAALARPDDRRVQEGLRLLIEAERRAKKRP